MIGKSGNIQSEDFNIGLYTRSDIINPNPNLSPNCMDVQWFFDNSIGKRLGSTTLNSVVITSGGAGGFIVQNSLTDNLISYWKMDEASGTRFDSYSNLDLNQLNDPLSTTGIRNQAANLVLANSQMFYMNTAPFSIGGSNFTASTWIMLSSTAASGLRYILRQNNQTAEQAWELTLDGTSLFFRALTDGGLQNYRQVDATSIGALAVGTWYNVVCWSLTNSHIGISVNLSVNTALFAGTFTNSGIKTFTIGGQSNGASLLSCFDGRVDETSIWNKVLTLTERQQLYANGSGNTYTSPNDPSTWYAFDFGAGTTRWLTIAAGTGLFASSNLGVTFLNIATDRTASFQYLDRSKNVLIATSDSYDRTLYWAGSAGTFAIGLTVNSAPNAKFSINYQGFLILLNYQNSNGTVSNRGFTYADENTQLTNPWNTSFELPSSDDDEITAPFILNKFLYVSTKYRIFRVSYTGGNPDWSYIEVKRWGFVPRTVRVFTLKNVQVAVGLDWSRRLRVFDGYDDEIISDNVESNNNYCEFATSKISNAGSALLVSNCEFDLNTQEYRLNLAIGAGSLQTTHAIVLNARTLSMYPYSNQQYNAMCMAQSNNLQFLVAFDRSGFCHLLNSGNLDAGVTPINDIYDSPLLFNKSPSNVTKNRQINFFFSVSSSGTLYYQERFDFSNVFSGIRPLRNYFGDSTFLSTESALQIIRTVDLPSVQNIYQYRLTSSSGTANPWRMTHFDLFNSDLGVGRGG